MYAIHQTSHIAIELIRFGNLRSGLIFDDLYISIVRSSEEQTSTRPLPSYFRGDKIRTPYLTNTKVQKAVKRKIAAWLLKEINKNL